MMKEDIKNIKKSKIFVSICLLVLAAIFVSCLSGASVAFANDGANTEEPPVTQDFTKTLERRLPYKVGENLKGKTAVIDCNIGALMNSVDFELSVENWLKEEGRQEGDLLKIINFENNDEDFVGFKALKISSEWYYELTCSGVFEMFGDEEGELDVIKVTNEKITFSSDKDYILQTNKFFHLSSFTVVEKSAKWLSPVKNLGDDFINIPVDKYSDDDKLLEAFPEGITNPTKVFAANFDLFFSTGVSNVVIKVQVGDQVIYPIIPNFMDKKNVSYSEGADIPSLFVFPYFFKDKVFYCAVKIVRSVYDNLTEGSIPSFVFDAYIAFFDENVNVWGIDANIVSVVSIQNGDDVSEGVYLPGAPLDKSLAPEKEGYNFVGFVDEDGNVHDTVPEGDVVLTPKYEIRTLKVTFDTDEPNIVDVEYGKTVAKPEDPEAPEGYEFGGWYKDYKHQNAFDFDEPITDDVTIYPEFIKVKIVENGGSGNAELKAFGQKCNEWFAKNWKIFTPCAVAGVAIIIFAIVLGVKAKRYR